MKYKVVGFDSFSHEDWEVGQYKTKEEAMEVAKSKGGEMTLMYVYNPKGERIAKFGSF